MKWLIACEESGVVRRAFRELGHDAWSCDLLPASDGSKYHIQGDALKAAYDTRMKWDAMLGHPPCTYLALCQIWRRLKPGCEWRDRAAKIGVEFAKLLWEAPIERIAIENPKSILSTQMAPKSQTIHPWQFGHMEQKETWLWLKKLPKLSPTDDVYGAMMLIPRNQRERVHFASPGASRSKDRSVTYEGIARAMAEQWGGLIV